jgi:hypothetical protein
MLSAPTKVKASSTNSFSSLSQPELYTNWAKFPSVHCGVIIQIITHYRIFMYQIIINSSSRIKLITEILEWTIS